MKNVTLPLTREDAQNLQAGDSVILNGVILTARDCAHKRFMQMLDEGTPLPFDIKNSVIYYAGPCPANPNAVLGSCGPTTSARMESFAPRLLNAGLNAIIGKGEMCGEVRKALVENCSVYFAAIGGAGALYSKCIKSCKCIAFPDLISEAVYRLEVENFPAIVAYDCHGNSIF